MPSHVKNVRAIKVEARCLTSSKRCSDLSSRPGTRPYAITGKAPTHTVIAALTAGPVPAVVRQPYATKSRTMTDHSSGGLTRPGYSARLSIKGAAPSGLQVIGDPALGYQTIPSRSVIGAGRRLGRDIRRSARLSSAGRVRSQRHRTGCSQVEVPQPPTVWNGWMSRFLRS